MDTTACGGSGGRWATDGIFRLPASPDECDSSVVAFWVVMGLLVVMRAAVLAVQWVAWCRRGGSKRRRVVASPNATVAMERRVGKRLPVHATINTLYVLTLVALVVAAGLNGVSFANNASSFALYSVNFALFALTATLSFNTMRRLGAGAMLSASARRNGGATDASTRFAQLATFDNVGRFVFTIQLASVLLSTVVFCVAGPLDAAHKRELAMFGFALKGTFILSLVLSITWHLQRGVRLLDGHIASSVHVRLGSSEESLVRTMKHARTRVRRVQELMLVTGIPTSVFWILVAAEVLPWTWFVLMAVFGYIDLVVAAARDCFFSRPVRSSKSASSDGVGGDGNGGANGGVPPHAGGAVTSGSSKGGGVGADAVVVAVTSSTVSSSVAVASPRHAPTAHKQPLSSPSVVESHVV